MTSLPILQELQSVHDNLAVIHRDLNNFPPDLAILDSDLKNTRKRLADYLKALESSEAKRLELSKHLTLALSLEEVARTAVKAAKQKIQYTSALRDLDVRERERIAIARPLKETELRIEALKTETVELGTLEARLEGEFSELHAAFLAGHANQVVAEKRLIIRKAELEQSLSSTELNRFNRILQQRQGRALVTVEGGTCTGCRTKVRSMLLHQLKETGLVSCEYCQRYLTQPPSL